jgi:hypothetical protein
MTTNGQLVFSLVVVFFPNLHLTFCSYVHYFIDMVVSIYLDPHEHVRNLKHHSLPATHLKYL